MRLEKITGFDEQHVITAQGSREVRGWCELRIGEWVWVHDGCVMKSQRVSGLPYQLIESGLYFVDFGLDTNWLLNVRANKFTGSAIDWDSSPEQSTRYPSFSNSDAILYNDDYVVWVTTSGDDFVINRQNLNTSSADRVVVTVGADPVKILKLNDDGGVVWRRLSSVDPIGKLTEYTDDHLDSTVYAGGGATDYVIANAPDPSTSLDSLDFASTLLALTEIHYTDTNDQPQTQQGTIESRDVLGGPEFSMYAALDGNLFEQNWLSGVARNDFQSIVEYTISFPEIVTKTNTIPEHTNNYYIAWTSSIIAAYRGASMQTYERSYVYSYPFSTWSGSYVTSQYGTQRFIDASLNSITHRGTLANPVIAANVGYTVVKGDGDYNESYILQSGGNTIGYLPTLPTADQMEESGSFPGDYNALGPLDDIPVGDSTMHWVMVQDYSQDLSPHGTIEYPGVSMDVTSDEMNSAVFPAAQTVDCSLHSICEVMVTGNGAVIWMEGSINSFESSQSLILLKAGTGWTDISGPTLGLRWGKLVQETQANAIKTAIAQMISAENLR